MSKYQKPAQIIDSKLTEGPDGDGDGEETGEGEGVPKYSSRNEFIPALHVSSETGGSFTYCSVLDRSPKEAVVPQPEAMVSSHPTYENF